MNDIIRKRKLYTEPLSYYVDFPSPIQVIVILNLKNVLTENRAERIDTSPKMHFKRFVSKEAFVRVEK